MFIVCIYNTYTLYIYYIMYYTINIIGSVIRDDV